MKIKFSTLLLVFVFISPLVNAAAVPQASRYDSRMQNVSYNIANATLIKSKLGFLTSIVFDENEAVLSTKTGFDAGWEVTSENNVVYILPRPVIQDQEGSEGEKIRQVFEPTTKDWKTNLLVRTSKRFYSLDLNLIEANADNEPAYVVKYQYPEEQAKLKADEQNRLLEEQESERNKQIIAKNFELTDAPKNWDYFMRVNEEFDSRRIAPDFVYDNGLFTYLGFNSSKTFPAPFVVKDGKEQKPAFNVEIKGKYKIMIIHNVNDKFVLRYGDSVVGVVNKSFGKMIVNQKNTASDNVERIEVKNDK